jgi:hypothetical protein
MKHPFYLELERRGAWVYTDVIFIGACLISHHINDKGHFVLDVITTPVDNRNQGHGTKVMTILKDISKTTNTPIELLVGVVKKNGIIKRHSLVGSHATQTKNKLPFKSLKKWYLNLGFIPCGKEDGRVKMIYQYNKWEGMNLLEKLMDLKTNM